MYMAYGHDPYDACCAGRHAPYAFRCGPDEDSARHATVAMRVESYDADWGYWTQDASRYTEDKTELDDDWLWEKIKLWNKEGHAMAAEQVERALIGLSSYHCAANQESSNGIKG